MMNVRVYLHGKTYYADMRRGHLRARRSLGTADYDEAVRRAEALRNPPEVEAAPIDLARRLQRMRERSKRRGHECTLTVAELEFLVRRAGSRCEVSGIAFSDWKMPGWDKAPYAPTIDRINSARPYTIPNCRVVCQAVNIALNEWGDEVFSRIVEGVCALRTAAKPHET